MKAQAGASGDLGRLARHGGQDDGFLAEIARVNARVEGRGFAVVPSPINPNFAKADGPGFPHAYPIERRSSVWSLLVAAADGPPVEEAAP